MSTNDEDYSAYINQPAGPSDNKLAQLTGLGAEQLEAEAEVHRLEAELEKAKERLKEIAERRMPNLMEEIGMKEFKLQDGTTIELGEHVHIGIPVAMRPRAYQWLRDNNEAALIKGVIKMEFGMKEDEKRRTIQDKIKELMGVGELPEVPVTFDESVNHQTLQAWGKKRLKDGKPMPEEIITVHRQPVAKVIMAK